MKNLLFLFVYFLVFIRSATAEEYKSTYQEIKWASNGINSDYCLDITDDKFIIYPGLQAVSCGKNLLSFSPVDYVENTLHGYLPKGFSFGWRVWSKQLSGEIRYGGSGYEGRVTVGDEIKILSGDVIENFRNKYFDNNYS